MSSLLQRRSDAHDLSALIESAPHEPVVISLGQRATLAQRFRAIGTLERRRLDAWSVERAGRTPTAFVWSPARAKRAIGRSALARLSRQSSASPTAAVAEEIDELFVRAAAGYARGGSLAQWIANQPPATVALTAACAVTWATTTLEVFEPVLASWTVCASDAFYDVAAANTTLRGCRDLVATTGSGRVVIRTRSGRPGPSSGPGLRADLLVDALSDVEGRLAQRFVGLWPDAGIALSVDGTVDDARAGARDLVRTAVAQRRARLKVAA